MAVSVLVQLAGVVQGRPAQLTAMRQIEADEVHLVVIDMALRPKRDDPVVKVVLHVRLSPSLPTDTKEVASGRRQT